MCVLTSIDDVAPLKDYFSNPFKQSPFLSFKRNLSFQSQNIWDNPNPSSAGNFGINQDWRPNPLCNVCRWGSEAVCITFCLPNMQGRLGCSGLSQQLAERPEKSLRVWLGVVDAATVGSRARWLTSFSLSLSPWLSHSFSNQFFLSRAFSSAARARRKNDPDSIFPAFHPMRLRRSVETPPTFSLLSGAHFISSRSFQSRFCDLFPSQCRRRPSLTALLLFIRIRPKTRLRVGVNRDPNLLLT